MPKENKVQANVSFFVNMTHILPKADPIHKGAQRYRSDKRTSLSDLQYNLQRSILGKFPVLRVLLSVLGPGHSKGTVRTRAPFVHAPAKLPL